jgi:hypothetical protein
MTKHGWLTFWASALFLSIGCSSGSSPNPPTPPTPPAPTYPAITGNWSLTATTSVPGQNIQIGTYLTNSSGTVSGTLHILNSECYALTQDIPVTGTISTVGALSITSSAVASQIITASGSISGSTLSSGSYSIAGGCAAGGKGTITGFIAPAFTNTYTGSFTSVSKLVIGTTVTTVQAGPDSDGLYSVTGTATFSNSPCFSTGTISQSAVAGSYLAVTIATDNGGTVVFAGYYTDSTGATITGDYQVTSGACSGDSGTGSLSHN